MVSPTVSPAVESQEPRYRLKRIGLRAATRRLEIEWGDGHISRFPFAWLRHEVFYPALGRPDQAPDAPYLLPELPDAAVIDSLENAGRELRIHWRHDGSRTRHDPVWLRDNCLSAAARQERRRRAVLWDREAAARFPWFGPDDLENPARRLALFEQLVTHGIALVRGLSCEPGTVAKVAAHFGPLRRTHFGTLFEVRSLAVDRSGTGANIGATAHHAQAPHTDEAWRHGPPGISFFHCLAPDPSGGGASYYVDGIAAAEALRESDPAAFDFLASVPIVFAAERNPEERFRTRGRMIATDAEGVVRGVQVSDRTLPPLDLPEDQIEPAYRAMGAFAAELNRPERCFERLLQPGELVIFDNHRILHARRAFDPSAGERRLQQVSVDREEFHNFFRQLAEQQGRIDLARIEPDAGVLSHA